MSPLSSKKSLLFFLKNDWIFLICLYVKLSCMPVSLLNTTNRFYSSFHPIFQGDDGVDGDEGDDGPRGPPGPPGNALGNQTVSK